MRRYLVSLFILCLIAPVFLGAQIRPGEFLNKKIDQIRIQSVPDSMNLDTETGIVPKTSGVITTSVQHTLENAWRRTWQNAGFEVYLSDYPGTYTTWLRVEDYSFQIHAQKKKGIFSGTEMKGFFNFSGEILIADSTGKVIFSNPLQQDEKFEIQNSALWESEAARRNYPIEIYQGRDIPEFRVLLLGITSAVIIYLFYSMRG